MKQSLLIIKILAILLLPLVFKVQGLQIGILMTIGLLIALFLIPWHLHKKNSQMSLLVDLLLLSGTALCLFGYAFDLFNDEVCAWWDECSHFMVSLILGIFVLHLAVVSSRIPSEKLWRWGGMFLVFSLIVLIGFLWEGVEFSFDKLFNLNMQPSHKDTISDLQLDTLAALIILLSPRKLLKKIINYDAVKYRCT